MKAGFIVLIIVVVVVGLVVFYLSKSGLSTDPYIEFEGNVTFVSDGDTLTLSDGQKVRLLGINAPEKGQPKYNEAKAFLSLLTANRTILVQSDIEKKDRYGRFLGYVFVDETFVNEKMLEQGLAVSWFIEPNFRYREELEAAEVKAKKESVGLWKLESGSCLAVLELRYDAEGNDNENLNDEYVVFNNVCNEYFDLTGWKVKDAANKVYSFPSISLAPKANITLRTGKGKNNNTDLYWGSNRGVWNNAGDVLYLQDPNGSLALEYPYP